MSNHRIHEQVIELGVRGPDAAELARALQGRLSVLQRRKLVDIIDRVCNALSPSGRIHRIESLELELGPIALDDFEADFCRKLELALRRALGDRIVELDTRPLDDVQLASESAFELLERYAWTGSLPWWADARQRGVAREALRTLVEAPADRGLCRRLITGLAADDEALARLVRAGDDATLAALVGRVSSTSLAQFVMRLVSQPSLTLAQPALRERAWVLALKRAIEPGKPSVAAARLVDALERIMPESLDVLDVPPLAAFVDRDRDRDRDPPSALEAAQDLARALLERDTRSQAHERTSPSSATDDTTIAETMSPEPSDGLATAWTPSPTHDDAPAIASTTSPTLDAAAATAPTSSAAHDDVPATASTAPPTRADGSAAPPATPPHPGDAPVVLPPRVRTIARALLAGSLTTADIHEHLGWLASPAAATLPATTRAGLVAALRELLHPTAPDEPLPRPSPRPNRLADLDGLPVDNAGLVIAWPFLEPLFQRCELVLAQTRTFVDDRARAQAVNALQYIACAELDAPEFALPLNKLLCGLEPNAPLDPEGLLAPLDPALLAECERMLGAVIAHAELGEMSLAELRTSFLRREGMLGERDGAWLLQVERLPHDLALDRFPWTWGWLSLPWMPAPLRVEW